MKISEYEDTVGLKCIDHVRSHGLVRQEFARSKARDLTADRLRRRRDNKSAHERWPALKRRDLLARHSDGQFDVFNDLVRRSNVSPRVIGPEYGVVRIRDANGRSARAAGWELPSLVGGERLQQQATSMGDRAVAC